MACTEELYFTFKERQFYVKSKRINNVSKCSSYINPLKKKRICFIEGLSAYRAVNTLHFGYKNQSLNAL
jgi:hypothetical protein